MHSRRPYFEAQEEQLMKTTAIVGLKLSFALDLGKRDVLGDVLTGEFLR